MSEQDGPGGLYETEIQRLQREADLYTRQLEHERKRHTITKDEYDQEMKTLEQIRASIKEKIPDETTEHRKKVALRSLHH